MPTVDLGDLMYSARRELGAFLEVVTDSFGTEEARLAAEDWLEGLDSVEPLTELTGRVLRTITIGSAARLAARLNAASSETKVSPIRSSNCPASEPLA